MSTKVRKEGEKESAQTTETLRTDYELSLPIFARMTGVPEATLASWEEGTDQLDSAALARIERIAGILHGLTRVMHLSFIPTWLEQPNDACKELGARAPLDLIERGDYAEVEGMVFYLESGAPN